MDGRDTGCMKRDDTAHERVDVTADQASPALLELRHAALQHELAAAFSAQPWPGALIDRLAIELATVEAAISIAQANATRAR